MSDTEQEWKLVYDARCYGKMAAVDGPVSPIVVDGPQGRELWLVDYDRFRDGRWGNRLSTLVFHFERRDECALLVRFHGGIMGPSFTQTLTDLAELFGPGV